MLSLKLLKERRANGPIKLAQRMLTAPTAMDWPADSALAAYVERVQIWNVAVADAIGG